MDVEIEKIPNLKCSKCDGVYVTMTDDGPECNDCDLSNHQHNSIKLSTEVEYLIYQFNNNIEKTNG